MGMMASQVMSLSIVKLCVTGLCEGNTPVTAEFPAQRASNTENVSIQSRCHDLIQSPTRSMMSILSMGQKLNVLKRVHNNFYTT